MPGPVYRLLPDGRRLHLQHGPIDLIVEADGNPGAVRAALRAATARFATVLEELVAELDALRRPARPGRCPLRGEVATVMWRHAVAHAPTFVTPMAGVAGAVAETVLAAMVAAAPLRRAYVNNGGDIALYLTAGARFDVGIVVDPAGPHPLGRLPVTVTDPSRGIATSGRHGRSLSLGIADSVTVLAETACAADVAATLLANAVDLPGHPAIRREPAAALQPDSDLGDRPVTVEVGALAPEEVAAALARGAAAAEDMARAGLLHTAILVLADNVRIAGRLPSAATASHTLREIVHA